ncbi:WUSCHEL-related homeobox 8-like [Impatiens glandulifera]|uniref:WUSCHEL-related homeobox 8-like n=1 Tax=Impatiens glandulifera TaxID=253017 RepID=UPI001FB14107|nr:WUSCHEL-related homeobox 8-like [Impatiens glandulifera]
MASSNKHWPSMFKSKPSSNHQNQYQLQNHHDQTVSSTERCPEPKARWNPKAEQIRILEGIFNSGMFNPPRDEIRKIRIQLQEYGEVGDANVFYWFQNRKSRSKHKLRHHNNPNPSTKITSPASITTTAAAAAAAATSSPTSAGPIGNAGWVFQASPNYQHPIMAPSPVPALAPDLYFPVHEQLSSTTTGSNNVLGEFPEVSSGGGDMVQVAVGHETVNVSNSSQNNNNIEDELLLLYGGGGGDLTSEGSSYNKIIVFINDVVFELAAVPINVKEVFGEDAVLYLSTGQPVLTDQWGLTTLQHGSFYYLIRKLSSSSSSDPPQFQFYNMM